MKKQLSITIITPTLNSENEIERFLDSINNQEYPLKRIEILIVDGKSEDKTVRIAKKYKCRIIKNPYVLADPAVQLGIRSARGDIIVILAVDNILRDRSCLKRIAQVFEDKAIMAAFPLQCSDRTDTIYTKYMNTFTDPFNHCVYGYGANGRTFNRIYKAVESNPVYDIYDYTSNPDRPLIAAAQGFVFRKGFTKRKNDAFDDILPVMDLIHSGKKIAFIHSVKLYHHTTRNLRQFMKKQGWATVNAIQKKKYGIAHRVNRLSKGQQLRVKLWPIYAFSIIFPTIRSLYGLIEDRDPIWLLHPFLSFASALASISSIIVYLLNHNYSFNRI
jgi:glycosyltransferase involved in cell wall biosynthesis